MKSHFKYLTVAVFVLLPAVTSAQAEIEAASFVARFNEVILYPLIALLTAVAFLVFLWGCAQYFINATNDQARQQGVKHITFGIIGLVVMLSAFAILNIAANTFGLGQQLSCADDPSQGGCDSVFSIPNNTSGGGGATPGPAFESGGRGNNTSGGGGATPGSGGGGATPAPSPGFENSGRR